MISQGLQRSFDGGDTWEFVETPFAPFFSPISPIAADPSDANLLLIGTPQGTYRSRDRGSSWHFLSASRILLDPFLAGRWFTVTDSADGLLVSTDHGETWNVVNGLPSSGQPISRFGFDANDHSLVYLFVGKDLYRSRNGGIAWSLAQLGPEYFTPFALVVAEDSTLFVLAWVSSGPPFNHVTEQAFRSLDQGDTWEELPDPFPFHPGLTFTGLVGVPDELLATSQFGFVRSDDGGLTWSDSNEGLRGTRVLGFGLDRQNPERLFGVDPDSGLRPPGFVRTLDRGATWQHQPLLLDQPGPTGLVDIEVDPTDPLHYIGLLGGTHETGYGVVTSSSDSGEHWSEPFPGPFLCPPDGELVVDPLQPEILYQKAELRFGACQNFCSNLRSTDSGQSWDCMHLPGDILRHIQPSPFERGVVLGAGYLKLFRSADSGVSWTTVAERPSYLSSNGGDIAWSDAHTAYVTSDAAGIYASFDAGLTWSARSEPPNQPQIARLANLIADPFHPGTLFALPKDENWINAREVVRSVDGGLTWNSISNGLLGWPLRELMIDPITPNRLYVSAEGGGILAYDVQIPEPCVLSATALCIADGRFRVESLWRDFAGRSGVGHAVPLASDTGSFWFFDPDNLELFVKEIDGVGDNNAFWTFYGALSNVEFTVLATDTATGAQHGYFNPIRTFGSRGDIESFPQEESLASPASAPAPAGAWLRPRAAPLRSVNACVPNATTLCLAGGRFAASVTWHDFAGRSGVGTPIVLTPDTGSFWFFDAGIHELAVKVIDGRGTNNAWWVFYGSLSNVEFELTVVDTDSGETWTRANPSGTFASGGDIEAFPQELP